MEEPTDDDYEWELFIATICICDICGKLEDLPNETSVDDAWVWAKQCVPIVRERGWKLTADEELRCADCFKTHGLGPAPR